MKLVPIVHSIHLPQPLYLADLSPTVCQIALAIDHIPAGFPSPAQGYAVNYLDFNQYLISNAAATIAVYCGGDSMVDFRKIFYLYWLSTGMEMEQNVNK